ncbi:MAG: hypothetical protein APF84_09855 [Gracilibacter sp. BRH_c7a]|nr:MAG: hypothetical protein APF84_09855 [Gracilibacter sp. BRH_c7a]
MKNNLLELINEILANSDREPIRTLDEEVSLRHDIGFDSIDLAVFTVNIENIFEVDIFETGNIDTIKDVLERLNK